MIRILAVLILIFSNIYAQKETPRVDDVQAAFASFEYPEAIRLSESLLAEAAALSDSQKIVLRRIRAISFYSLGDVQKALNEYLEILNIDRNFTFDPVKTSPKIIRFFEDIRENLPDDVQPQQATAAPPDTVFLQSPQSLNSGIMLRSLALPGWGHLAKQSSPKGWLLLGLGAASLGGTAYFINDARQKNRDYLNETERSQIDTRYDAYNSAYQKRNLFIAAFAAIWLYSQADLLFFSNSGEPRQPQVTFNVNPGGYSAASLGIALHW